MHVPAVVTIHPCPRRSSPIELLSFLSLLVYQESKKQIQRKIHLLFRLWRRAAVPESRWELAALIQCPTLQHEREGNTGCKSAKNWTPIALHFWSFSRFFFLFIFSKQGNFPGLAEELNHIFPGIICIKLQWSFENTRFKWTEWEKLPKNYQKLPEEATASSFYCKDHTLGSTLV